MDLKLIKTAPKDEPIIGYWEGNFGIYAGLVSWDEDGWFAQRPNSFEAALCFPTHWMPLPQPPNTTTPST